MDPRTHHLLDVNGTRIHAVEQGTGPLVLLIHGFPESWYSWRHQLTALAEAGYRAVAIDQRGYGRSSKFWTPASYRIRRLVEDAVGVVHAMGESKAVIVGHDWGAPVAWTSAWLHPEVFRGVVGLSVPFSGRGLVALPGSPFGERRPDELHAELAGPGQDFYQDYFGTLGPVIEEFEFDLRGWIRDGVFSLSGDALAGSGLDFDAMDPVALIRGSAICVPHGTRMRDRFMAPTQLPAWFTEADLDFYTNEFERSGLAGPLSYYREITASWESLESQADQPLTPPAMCILGEFDVVRSWGLEALARAPERMPNYLGTRVLEGCGHWTQQERATETSAALITFLRALPPDHRASGASRPACARRASASRQSADPPPQTDRSRAPASAAGALDGATLLAQWSPWISSTPSLAVLPAPQAARSFAVSTLTPIQLHDSDLHPRTGAVQTRRRTGVMNLRVLSTEQVLIQLDANRDGSFESSTPRTRGWPFGTATGAAPGGSRA